VHVISAKQQRKFGQIVERRRLLVEERLKKLRVLLDWGGLHFAFVGARF